MLRELKIELTNRCARNCKHCSSSATNDNKNLKELEFENVSRIIKEAKIIGVERIVFTGGEPLMYDKLSELVKLTSSLNMNSTIYSFAYRTDDTLMQYRYLIECGLNKIIYSLADTLSDEKDLSTYDKEKFFDKVFTGNNCTLGFHYAVSKDSIGFLNQVVNNTIELFDNKKYFDKISLLRFVPHGKGNINMDLSKVTINLELD